MLRSAKSLDGYAIRAKDGDIGKVSEFYFDDQTWTIRYLVVNTGNWLDSRPVLIPRAVLGQPNWEGQVFAVALTRDQVEHSPDADTDQPVSRQKEIDLHTYYSVPYYWMAESGMGAFGMSDDSVFKTEADPEDAAKEEEGNPHLRSMHQVIGYGIRAQDGEIGHVEDFILDDETWSIRYIVVDTRNWLPGKKVLVVPQWIEKIEWAGAMVAVNLERKHIEAGPEFDPSAPVNRAYEERLYDYYGQPKYWEGEESSRER